MSETKGMNQKWVKIKVQIKKEGMLVNQEYESIQDIYPNFSCYCIIYRKSVKVLVYQRSCSFIRKYNVVCV